MAITPFPHGESVVVVSPAGRDNHGDPLPGTERTIDGVAIYPASIDESVSGSKVDADLVMLGPAGINIAAEDVIYRVSDSVRAHPLYAKGDAWNIRHPMTGWEAGSRVLLTYAKGGL